MVTQVPDHVCDDVDWDGCTICSPHLHTHLMVTFDPLEEERKQREEDMKKRQQEIVRQNTIKDKATLHQACAERVILSSDSIAKQCTLSQCNCHRKRFRNSRNPVPECFWEHIFVNHVNFEWYNENPKGLFSPDSPWRERIETVYKNMYFQPFNPDLRFFEFDFEEVVGRDAYLDKVSGVRVIFDSDGCPRTSYPCPGFAKETGLHFRYRSHVEKIVRSLLPKSYLHKIWEEEKEEAAKECSEDSGIWEESETKWEETEPELGESEPGWGNRKDGRLNRFREWFRKLFCCHVDQETD